MNDKQAHRPLILDVNDTKQTLIQTINDAINVKKIPCFMLEPFLSELLSQVRTGAQEELARARQQEALMKEVKKNESDKMHNDKQSVVQAD